jgi:hypothetical protein
MTDTSPAGYTLTIPGGLADELRREVWAGRMTFNEFDHRIAETGHTLSLNAIRFLFATYLTDDF